jgi:protein-S-isoprenylcysteine O-methyltransferase Ste14
MTLATILKWLGGLLAYTVLGIILYGIWRGTHRPAGLTTGLNGSWLRSPWFYIISSALFFGISYIGWIPLPWTVSSSTRVWMLIFGALLYFPGILLVLWARLTLGKNYFVSTGFGAQLFKDHQLVTCGPFAIVRHPMYMGLILAALGSIFLYFTWTTLLFVCFAPFVMIRAYREEGVLAAEFGVHWQEYCKRVPAFFKKINQ